MWNVARATEEDCDDRSRPPRLKKAALRDKPLFAAVNGLRHPKFVRIKKKKPGGWAPPRPPRTPHAPPTPPRLPERSVEVARYIAAGGGAARGLGDSEYLLRRWFSRPRCISRSKVKERGRR